MIVSTRGKILRHNKILGKLLSELENNWGKICRYQGKLTKAECQMPKAIIGKWKHKLIDRRLRVEFMIQYNDLSSCFVRTFFQEVLRKLKFNQHPEKNNKDNQTDRGGSSWIEVKIFVGALRSLHRMNNLIFWIYHTTSPSANCLSDLDFRNKPLDLFLGETNRRNVLLRKWDAISWDDKQQLDKFL